MSDRKVVRITGHAAATDSKLEQVELILTDTSLRYYDITTQLDPRVTPVKKQSFTVEDRDQAKVKISLEGNFFVTEVKHDELTLRKNIESNLKLVLQNQTITLNPDLYYGKRLYNVLEMDLPELLVPGNNQPVMLGSAASRPYDSTTLIFNAQREADLDRYLRDAIVSYEIRLTRHDGLPTNPTTGYLSFAEIKNSQSRGFVLLPGVPTSAFNLSSIQFSYRITTHGGARIDALEDEKKDFLQVRVSASSHQTLDMKTINKAHTLDFLEMKCLLNGEGLFKYLNVDFPRFRVFYDSGSETSYNSVQPLDLSASVKKTQHELLIDMASLVSVDYLDKKSFLRIKGLVYFEQAPAEVANFSYEMFGADYKPLSEEHYVGRCHFRKVIEDVASRRLLSLDTQGDPYFFEMDIKDPLKENNSVCYYRISLKDPFSSIKTDQIFFSRVDFYFDRKLTFAAITQGLDLPYEGLDIAPVLQGSSLEAFLAEHTLAYTAIPFSFERMAKDVRMGGNFPETVAGKVSVHGYSKTGRKLFSTPWLTRNSIEEPLSWWRGVEVLVLCIWMRKDALSAMPSPYTYRAEREFDGGTYDAPYFLAVEGRFNPYTYIPCLKGNHVYELDPLFSNTLYIGQGRSRVQGRGSPNTIYLMWDSHTTFDFAAEEDLQRSLAPSRLKLIGVELENVVIQVPGPEDERWGSIVLEWALLVDPGKELAATREPAVLARLQGSRAALKEGSLTLVNFLKEPIGEFLEIEIRDRIYVLEVSPNDGKIHWRRQVDLSREALGEKTVLRRWSDKTEYVLRNSILGKPNTPLYPSDDGQDILIARGDVAYLHGGKRETQLVGNLPENFFYLDQGGTDNVIANGYRNTIEISSALGGDKVLFLSTKKQAINFVSAAGVSFRTAQIKDDDLLFFLEAETYLLTICLKGVVAWPRAAQNRLSLLLEEGMFSADQLLEFLRLSESSQREETYRLQSVLPAPALQRGFAQLADRVVEDEHSKAYLKDQIKQYDVVEKE
ncbi:hypothetical protein [Pseudomonas gingeri]|uniref:hypothetical protein n=1 Tax=Pseudomonas gingeri TaxID=117681 RepID=UPI0015A10407|nr:hypothetical protein [Pseudomonas gingeri]NWA00466.1 hypothetical protein [Pseudomonas gingeri]NWA14820.1 hypothetical protein [Pseudomonas gingeri]NWA58098.1 hypothetical protein [Pseudomonas gingeri]NWA96804.1 hypothetical protein [Pseudomonas gingeri]NWB03876.1 hypothetical protein [Pseudomonas gingeri]